MRGGFVASHDWATFAEYVAARSGSLQRAAYLMVGDVGLAQDLVQEALIKTYTAWPRLRDPADAEAYTRKAITTTAVTWFRRRDGIDEQSWARQLPIRQRVAIVLRYYEDLTEAQTAEAMGCSIGMVRSKVAAGMPRLRDWVGPSRVPVGSWRDGIDNGESFRAVLHRQATTVDVRPPDLEAIRRAGGRRLRSRYVAAAIATLTAIAVGVAGAILLPDGGKERRLPVPPGPWPSDAVSWASGTSIYVATALGTEEIEVGHEVHAYVRTVTGFVVLDETDAVFSVTAVGVDQIGQVHDTRPGNTDQQRLVANTDGTLAGWVDEAASRGRLTMRVYDAVHGEARDFPGPGAPLTDDGAVFFAIDDRTGYWRGPVGLFAVDLDTGAQRVVLGEAELAIPDDIYSFELYSAQNGVLAFSPDDDGTFFAGRSIDDARELQDFTEVRGVGGHTDPVRLSPTGAWLSFGVVEVLQAAVVNRGPEDRRAFKIETMSPVVFDTATGEQRTLTIPGDPLLAFPVVWLDSSTLQVASFTTEAERPDIPTSVVFYKCPLTDAICEVVAEVGPPILATVALPGGRWYGP
jgi:DNA-directed RNA polymerase specialized sigma24 family protein